VGQISMQKSAPIGSKSSANQHNEAGIACYPTNPRNLVSHQIHEELFGECDGYTLVFGFGAALVMLPIVPASTPPIR
jgi:hypothetical protein